MFFFNQMLHVNTAIFFFSRTIVHFILNWICFNGILIWSLASSGDLGRSGILEIDFKLTKTTAAEETFADSGTLRIYAVRKDVKIASSRSPYRLLDTRSYRIFLSEYLPRSANERIYILTIYPCICVHIGTARRNFPSGVRESYNFFFSFTSSAQTLARICARNKSVLRATAGARLHRVKGECIGASYIYAIDSTSVVRT